MIKDIIDFFSGQIEYLLFLAVFSIIIGFLVSKQYKKKEILVFIIAAILIFIMTLLVGLAFLGVTIAG